MLGVVLFIAFWVVLGFGFFFVAVRGGLGGARATFQRQSHTAARVVGLGFAVMLVFFGIVLPVLLLVGNHSNASGQVGGMKLTQGQKAGRELFGEHCALCHTLGAANAIGKVGPNLDTLKPPESLVLNTINNGCLPNASGAYANQQCLGQGVMPSGIVQGRDAQNVASFVAHVAGKE